MTVPELEDALVEFVAMNTNELRYRSNDLSIDVLAPQVRRGFVGRNEVGEVVAGDITTYPAVIVRAKQGVQSDDYEVVTVEFLIGCFDDSLDQQGYRDCMQLVERIKQRLREQSIVRRRFPVRLPLNWQVNKAINMGSYYFGEIQCDFHLPVMGTQYDGTPMSADVMEGRLDVAMYHRDGKDE